MPDDYATVIRRAIDIEAEHKSDSDWLGFSWYEVNAHPSTLQTLVRNGVLRIRYRSRQYTHYRIADPEKALAEIAGLEPLPEDTAIPLDLFDIIIGYDNAKAILHLALDAPRPVHALLYGPPATAKTLFLSELSRLRPSRMALGGTTSKAGVVDFVLQSKPRYLIIDELDKMDARDYSVLLSLMETGYISKLKSRSTASEHVTCWVFAGANSVAKIPPELKSRFMLIPVQPYTEDEFKAIVEAVLTKREDVDPELAKYIASKVKGYTTDVREAVRIGRMARSVQEVDNIISMRVKHEAVS